MRSNSLPYYLLGIIIFALVIFISCRGGLYLCCFYPEKAYLLRSLYLLSFVALSLTPLSPISADFYCFFAYYLSPTCHIRSLYRTLSIPVCRSRASKGSTNTLGVDDCRYCDFLSSFLNSIFLYLSFIFLASSSILKVSISAFLSYWRLMKGDFSFKTCKRTGDGDFEGL